ncbi:MAG: response regulator transcription factor [Alsobacter sp.]
MDSLHPRAAPITLLIADDHWVVRESLKSVARSIDPAVVVEEASNFDEALAVLHQNPAINLLLVDLIMPGFAEFEGLELLRSRYPGTPIVVFSIHEDPEYVRRAIQHGVIGYVPKSADAAEIQRALSRVMGGEVYFPRDLLTRTWSAAKPEEPARSAQAASPLTAREDEILVLLGRGKSTADIAGLLAITRQTVRVHLANAMRKLGLKNRESAIRFAVAHAAKVEGAKT